MLHILEREQLVIRFEDMCVATMSDFDQVTYVATSRTYDLGRDGRVAGIRSGNVPPFICCSCVQHERVVEKAILDFQRLLENARPEHVVFCFTDSQFTEYTANTIEKEIRRLLPEIVTVRSFGPRQLSEIVVRNPRGFEQLYAAEISDIRSALSMKSTNAIEVELTGLRLALTTNLSDDAETRRQDLVRNLVLTVLATKDALTPSQIAQEVSRELHLARTVHVGWLQSQLNELVASSCVETSNGAFSITDAGKEEIRQRTERGSVSILDGKKKIADAIEEMTGTAPSETEIRQLWNILQDSISTMFTSHGETIVESVASVLGGLSNVQQHETLVEQINRIGQRIRGLPGQGARIEEVAQAIVDVFTERTSDAFSWLANICEVFVQVCALGLEPSIQEQISSQLKEVDLILDTDVVLSLLSKGEPNHDAVVTIARTWERIGGAIYVTAPVLEEVAHHADIAQVDYENVWRDLDKTEDSQLPYIAKNVFVRAFAIESRSANASVTPNHWNKFISAFRGRHHLDYDKILDLLRDEQCDFLSESDVDADFARRMEKSLFDQRKTRIGSSVGAIEDLRHKCSRDGRLLAIILWYRKKLTEEGHRTAFIVSGGFRAASRILQHELQGPEPVLYPAAVAWLLSLVPGVKLSGSTLRAVLFDANLHVQVDPLDRTIFRVLQSSQEYSIHRSRRATLRNAIRGQIRKRATDIGISEGELTAKVVAGDVSTERLTTEVVAEAIDEVARSRSEEEVADLRGQVEKLTHQLEEERQKRRGRETRRDR